MKVPFGNRVMNRTLAFLCLLAGLSSLGAFSQERQEKTEPGRAEAPKTAVPARPEGVGEPVDPNRYVIGAQDILFVRVWREPDFTGPYGVRPDGKITLPLIGDVQAAGLTPQQLSKSLVKSLSKLINNPDVSVGVQAVQSKKYFIDGEVMHAGEFSLVTPTTVMEALSKAGGFRDFANKKKIRILRGTETLKFNYNEVSKGKNMEQNVLVENGDHIIVP